jgi:two-component system C4-dicarboxylate transport sensor histidine kinase DctB
VIRALEPRLQSEGVTFQTQIAPDLPRIDSDNMQLEIVLHNLLANAIDAVASKGQTERAVALRVGVAGDQVVLAVEDSGPGVSGDTQATLFEPFNTTKTDGMGLGLAISRSLLRAHGGELSYSRSESLGGACFRASVRIWQVESNPARAAFA